MHSDKDLFSEVVGCSGVSVVSRAQPADSNMSRADGKLPLVRPLGCGCVGWLQWDGRRDDEFETVRGF